MYEENRFLKTVEVLVIGASLLLIVYGVFIGITVQSQERKHFKEMEQITSELKQIVGNRKACIIVEPSPDPGN